MPVNVTVRVFLSSVMLFSVILFNASAYAEEKPAPATVTSVVPIEAVREDLSQKSLDELVKLAWASSGKDDYKEVSAIVNAIFVRFEPKAMALHSNLTGFPPRDKVEDYKVMNDVATAHFILAEALMHQGKSDEAVALFKEAIQQFPYAQSWDPSRGSYWSVAEKSQASIDVINGVNKKEEMKKNVPVTLPHLATPGTDKIIDYTKYGTFTGIGTRDYKFHVKNPTVLSKAMGEAIYPNTCDVLKDPRYKEVYKEGRLQGSHWDFVNTTDLEAAVYKWAMAPEPPGLKLFYTGLIFEKAGMYLEAIKAYHALVVFFPETVAWTYWQTPWYPAQAAVAKIRYILRMHPEFGLAYKGGKVEVFNGFDNDIKNDVYVTNPGTIESQRALSASAQKALAHKREASLGKPVRWLGGKKVYFAQYKNGHWRMFVDGQPFIIKGMNYSPSRIGESPDKGTLANWTTQDTNKNGKADGPYDAWVDKNGNNTQDPDEPTVGDFQLMKDMGVNAIRFYHQPHEPDKDVFRDLYNRFGIKVIMGDFLGKYTLGSGADWATGTDYENPEHLKKMMESVEKMVKDYKDEPFILLWLLGNENNYGVASNADKKPEAYYKFLNQVAKRIKELDPDHPVAACNGDILYLDKMAKYAPEVDVLGANIYRGDYGFGSFWNEVRHSLERPAFITEYGAPAYAGAGFTTDQSEGFQAAYHKGNWLDIMENSAGYEDGEGNAVGGVPFEWLDEWYKNYEPLKHDTKADVIGPFPGGYYYEEWFGIVSQGDGSQSPFLRQLRKAYYTYQEMWRAESLK
ncbi:MAG: tetratricopeptide repeat protein [Candidatus Omnitrophica bacterium]|nr:tetratricopeptide repeat protein [Candidatus Omnitrophota bacterium]